MDWSNRKVLVTGHTGFKGAWLSLWLQDLGAEVIGLALPPTKPSLFDSADVSVGMRSVLGDLRDLAAVEKCVREADPEVVFHLAAQPLVRRSYENPIETYATNVLGTAHLLEAVRKTRGVRAIVVVTSDKCYENREWYWSYREIDRLGGRDPYSNSKACAELVAAAYAQSFFNPERFAEHGVAMATARAGNVIGGGDWATDRLVPDIVRAFSRGRPVLIRNPDAVRPWQHVLESLSGYLVLAERLLAKGPEFAEPFNFGPPVTDAVSVSKLVEALADLWGENAKWQRDATAHPHEARLLTLDSSKARDRLKWRPRLSVREALAWTVNWYRHAVLEAAPMRDFTIEQIRAYIEKEERQQ